MDYTDLLRRLWRLRLAVALIVLVGAVLGVLSYYKLSFSPLGLDSKSETAANAGIDVLVTAPRVPTQLEEGEFTDVIERSRLLVATFASQPVRELTAERAGIPLGSLSVSNSIADENGDSSTSAGTDTAATFPLRVIFRTQSGLPLIVIRGFADSGPRAERLALAAFSAAQDYGERIQAQTGVPPNRRLQLQALDEPRALVTVSGPTVRGAVFNGIAVGAVLIVLLLVVDVGVMYPTRFAGSRGSP